MHVVLAAMATGSAVSFFLWALDAVTALRWAHPWLLWLLPIAGLVSGLLYARHGGAANRGTAVLLDEIAEPASGVPRRMAPMVLAGTLLTHLFGGSAGREGTAVQMGGSIASALERGLSHRLPALLALTSAERSLLLQAGMAAGFGAVFGTPITGALFALEVSPRARRSLAALIACAIASFVGDAMTTLWGAHHTIYDRIGLVALGVGRIDPGLLLRVAIAAVCFGLASLVFVRATHAMHLLFDRLVRQPWLRPALGGVVVVALTLVVGSTSYLGLGVRSPDPTAVTILTSFGAEGAEPWSWALKLLFTAVTLGAGFKGGEVTPLFFIGATLGNTLALLMGAPVALFAAIGFVAVFAGATRTPLACTVMGLELFGIEPAVYLAMACIIAVLCAGRRGIYHPIPRARASRPIHPPVEDL